MSFQLTYSTMFDPPEELHERFEAALAAVRGGLGATHPLYLGGEDLYEAETYPTLSPADRRVVLGRFPVGRPEHVERAMASARAAFPAWRATPHPERVRLLRRAAAILEERVYAIGAALALEVGKNRMEALGETQETADFFSGYARDFEAAGYFERDLPDDPLSGYRSHNRSVLKPYGVWGVIAPFNFPLALAGGPAAAALVTGNTVVLKSSEETPWSGRLLADCLRDAGFPPGVFHSLVGGADVGAALAGHPELAGITFTGSQEVGMGIYRRLAAGPYPRPCIAEMGGKNACLVTARADLGRAATGIVRSAFGLSGQKCSAVSRVYAEGAVAGELVERVVELARGLRAGDPVLRESWLGPVISEETARRYESCCAALREDGGRILFGGRRLSEGALAEGSFVAPTVAEAPADHPLFGREMFLPIVMVARVRDLDEGIALANRSDLGLTAGCYGSEEEVRRFLDRVEAGVLYVNRPQGATTGAWPGYQAFGGWKGSGSTGKAIGSFYYLPQYLREQSQTWVE